MDEIIENIEKGIANGKAKAEANSGLDEWLSCVHFLLEAIGKINYLAEVDYNNKDEREHCRQQCNDLHHRMVDFCEKIDLWGQEAELRKAG